MTHETTEYGERPQDNTEIKPFDVYSAPLEALSYGSDGGLEVHLKGRKTLWQANPNEDRRGLLGGARPHEDVWLRQLTLFGSSDGFVLGEVWNLKMLREKLEGVTETLSQVSDMDDEILSLKAMTKKVADRREVARQNYKERINAYLQTQKSPYWVIVASHEHEATETYSPGYVKTHKLAPLAAIDFAEDGELRSLLTQADGTLGFVAGRTQLYY